MVSHVLKLFAAANETAVVTCLYFVLLTKIKNKSISCLGSHCVDDNNENDDDYDDDDFDDDVDDDDDDDDDDDGDDDH